MLGKREADYSQDGEESQRTTSSSKTGYQLAGGKVKLDIEKMRGVILREIGQQQVTIISGETGCGKSTQVPQYILQDASSRGKRCKILCTQPRRIACISIAKRVAAEMGQEIGEQVGYHISMDVQLSSDSQIIFVTNGILLNYLTHNPSMLTEYTHIIIDEVHERDIDSDFILILFKLFLNKFPDLKLVLMSATINAELFARYFAKQEIDAVASKTAASYNSGIGIPESSRADCKQEKAEVKTWANFDYSELEVKDTWRNLGQQLETPSQPRPDAEERRRKELEGLPMATILAISSHRKYLIREVYLNELNSFEHFHCGSLAGLKDFTFNKKRAVLIVEVAQLAIKLVDYLHRNERHIVFPTKKIDNGGILIFMPGLNEITYFIQMMREHLSQEVLSQLEIIPLHSSIAQIYENDVFSHKRGVRKVIVSTNIAESSLTIPDIIFVIDFCLTKEFRFDVKVKTERLDLTWASKASCRQRTGRTGRVCDGISFRLVTKNFYDHVLDPFNEAEMLRVPLDKVLLKICVLHEEIERKNDPVNEKVFGATRKPASVEQVNDIFLSIAKNIFCSPGFVLEIAIEQPTKDQIEFAMRYLEDNGCFIVTDRQKLQGRITFLGRVYSDFPCSLAVVKLLLYGSLFGCFEEALTVGVMANHPKSIWQPTAGRQPQLNVLEFYRRLDRMSDGEFSDHILYLNMFRDWLDHFGEGSDLAKMRGRRLSAKQTSRLNPSLTQHDWNKLFNVRHNYMNEIAENRADFRRRMLKFVAISEAIKQAPQPSDSERQHLYLKLKVCLAGAFLPCYAVGVFKPSTKQQNELSNIKTEYKLDPVHTMNIYDIQLYKYISSKTKTSLDESDRLVYQKYESIPDTVKIDMWRSVFLSHIEEKYGKTQKIVINPRCCYVQFRSDVSDLSIRSVLFEKHFHKGLKSRMSVYSLEKGMTSVEVENSRAASLVQRSAPGCRPSAGALMQDLRTDITALVHGLYDVAYCYAPTYSNPLSYSEIFIDSLSIAAILTRARKGLRWDNDAAASTFIVYSEDAHNSGRTPVAKTCSLMPSFPMFFEYMLLLFGNTVYLEADQTHDRITHIKYLNAEIPLGHWLEKADVATVNKIREVLKFYFEEKDNKKVPTTVWKDILGLLLCEKRERFVPIDEWFEYFLHNVYVGCAHQKTGSYAEKEDDLLKLAVGQPAEVQRNTYEGGFMNSIPLTCDLSRSKEQIFVMRQYLEWKKAVLKE